MFTKKQIWALLIPLMMEQVLGALMGSMDTMMVSNVGSAAISAVSLVDSVNVVAVLVFTAMATGGTIVTSQYVGANDQKAAINSAEQFLLTTFSIAIVSTTLVILFREPLLRLVFGQIEQDVMANALVYLFITALSYPFLALYNSCAALFRASGNSRLPMIISVTANIMNVIGNALTIFVFGMGVAGAALSTLLSRGFSALVLLIYLRRPRQIIVVRDYLSIRPQWAMIKKIMSIGVPNGIENAMFQVGKLAIQSTVSTLGTVAIAAQAMTSVLEVNISYMALGIGLGMTTIVGQCVGAGRPDEAKKYVKLLSFYGEVSILICSVLIALAVKPITVIAGMEPEVAELTIKLTYLICAVKSVAWVVPFMPVNGMRAAGDVKYAMVVSGTVMWTCRVAVAVLCVRVLGLGLIGIWIGMFTDWFVRAIFMGHRFRSGKWLKKSIVSA